MFPLAFYGSKRAQMDVKCFHDRPGTVENFLKPPGPPEIIWIAAQLFENSSYAPSCSKPCKIFSSFLVPRKEDLQTDKAVWGLRKSLATRWNPQECLKPCENTWGSRFFGNSEKYLELMEAIGVNWTLRHKLKTASLFKSIECVWNYSDTTHGTFKKNRYFRFHFREHFGIFRKYLGRLGLSDTCSMPCLCSSNRSKRERLPTNWAIEIGNAIAGHENWDIEDQCRHLDTLRNCQMRAPLKTSTDIDNLWRPMTAFRKFPSKPWSPFKNFWAHRQPLKTLGPLEPVAMHWRP